MEKREQELKSKHPAQAHLFLDVGIASGELLAMSYLYVDGRRVLATSNAGHLVRAALAHLAGFAQDARKEAAGQALPGGL